MAKMVKGWKNDPFWRTYYHAVQIERMHGIVMKAVEQEIVNALAGGFVKLPEEPKPQPKEFH